MASCIKIIYYYYYYCVCGDLFDADHAMICMRGGYIIQRHNEIRDLEAEILRAVCTDVEMEPVLQDVTGEVLPRGAKKAPDREQMSKNLVPWEFCAESKPPV